MACQEEFSQNSNALTGADSSVSRLTLGCLFAGMGGFAQGFKQSGFFSLWANEADTFATATFRANHPETRVIEEDVRKIGVHSHNLKPVDVLTAGFPCQSFSVSGNKTGFDDERGKLFFEIIRLVGEFGVNRPKILLLENVPYLMHGANGAWFARIVQEVQFAGYWFDRNCSRVLNTCKVSDLPQNRERLFMAALSTDAYKSHGFEFPGVNGAPLALDNFLRRNKKANSENYLPADNRYFREISDKMRHGNRKSIYQLRRVEVREKPGLCPTLTANMGGGGHNVPFIFDRWGLRRLMVDECAELQGFKDYRFPAEVPPGERYRQIGNAVSVPVAKNLAKECARLLSKRRAGEEKE